MLTALSDLTSIAGAVAATFTQVLSGAGIAVVAVKFLCQKYQAMYVKSYTTGRKLISIFPCNSPLTALCLGAYIVDLTLILHDIFIATLVMEPPRPLNRELIAGTLESYKDSNSGKIHRLIGDIASGTRALVDPKEKLADLIRQQLKMDRE